MHVQRGGWGGHPFSRMPRGMELPGNRDRRNEQLRLVQTVVRSSTSSPAKSPTICWQHSAGKRISRNPFPIQHGQSGECDCVREGWLPGGPSEHANAFPFLFRSGSRSALASLRPCQNGAKSSPCGTTGGTSTLGCCEGLGGVGRSPNVTLNVWLVPSRNSVISID